VIRKTDVIIIGAGQAGLATSRCLTDLGIDHVVFERGEIAQRWRTERRKNLHLLTPNWMTRLPSWSYVGADPDGFMHKDDVVQLLSDYSDDFAAPVQCNTEVRSVSLSENGYRVITDTAFWMAKSVVIATGACDKPLVPEFARYIHPLIRQVTPDRLDDISEISHSGILVVGASATGIQLADELLRGGCDVTLAAGSHVRTPRRYRGRDIMYWLDQSGVLSELRDSQASLKSVLHHPSFQLVGSALNRDLDLGSISRRGAKIVGRVTSMSGRRVFVSNTLSASIDAADARQKRLLSRIDHYIESHGIDVPVEPVIAPIKIRSDESLINLAERGIKTIIWATGYKREYLWLNVPVKTAKGEIDQAGGVTSAPGLFTMGLPFMRRRNSTFIDGVGADAHEITKFIAAHLGLRSTRAA
jgi:putative flavoprotein involved in K+ transport